MKNILMLALSTLVLLACGEDQPAVELIKLETFEDRLSYALGAMNGKALLEEPNGNLLDKELVVKGFKENYSSQSVEDCDQTMLKLYGPYGMDFDSTYKKEGSICKGRQLGHFFYKGMSEFGKLKTIKKDKLLKGLEHALNKADTLLNDADQQKVISEFYTSIMKESADKLFANARKKKNVREIEGGILIETIEDGKGGSPTDQDDVKADYILMASTGDTIQNSLMFRSDPKNTGEAPAFNLQQVFPGWTKSFPNLKKGGKYRLYLPWEMVNDPRLQNQSVCFYVHFIDYGPAFTLAEKAPQQ